MKYFKHVLPTNEKIICIKATKRLGRTITETFPNACWNLSLCCWTLEDNEFYEIFVQKFVEKYNNDDEKYDLENRFFISLQFAKNNHKTVSYFQFERELKRNFDAWLKIEDEDFQKLLNELSEKYYVDTFHALREKIKKLESKNSDIDDNEFDDSEDFIVDNYIKLG